MKLKPPYTEDRVRSLGVADMRRAYIELGETYNKILNGKVLFCHNCNDFHAVESFYPDMRYSSGYYPECRKSLLMQATDYDKKTDTYTDNRDKTIEVFRKLNMPFKDSMYRQALEDTKSDERVRAKQTAYQQLLAIIRSLPNYRGMTFADSEFDADDEVLSFGENRKARKEIKRIFGSGFTEADYVFLQDQYDDWRARTQVDSKAQETYVMQICLQLLDIDKDRKNGKDVTNKLKALDALMNSANLQPKQNVNNAATDSLSFGQMIEKWENEEPIPEPSEEFKDVDGIGKYIRVWFTGWLCKALGIKNSFAAECEEYVKQYEVTKPEYQEEGSSDEIYSQLFGVDEG